MNAPSTADVVAEIQRTAEAELGFRGSVEPCARLVEDLGIDSLGAIVIAVALEDRFRVQLNEQDAGELVTVADLIALVQRRHREASKHADGP
jgi:acyl carrier protein